MRHEAEKPQIYDGLITRNCMGKYMYSMSVVNIASNSKLPSSCNVTTHDNFSLFILQAAAVLPSKGRLSLCIHEHNICIETLLLLTTATQARNNLITVWIRLSSLHGKPKAIILHGTRYTSKATSWLLLLQKSHKKTALSHSALGTCGIGTPRDSNIARSKSVKILRHTCRHTSASAQS